MRGGVLLHGLPSLQDIRAHAREKVASLPTALRSLDQAPLYQVAASTNGKAVSPKANGCTGS